MKGAPGIIVAVFLGLLGMVLNWIYIENQTRDVDAVSFLGIREDLEQGEVLRKKHFTEVRIPKRHSKNLVRFVYLYEDQPTVEGSHATRPYEAGDLLDRAGVKTPPPELKLEPNTYLFWVSVDTRNFVPELVEPGDEITFIVPVYASDGTSQPPGAGQTPGAPASAIASGPTESIGPFTIKSLGNRLGSTKVMKSSRRTPVQERQIGIVVDERDELEVGRAKRLQDLLSDGQKRGLQVRLHPRK